MRLTILGGGGFRVPLVYRALASGPHSGLVTELTLYDTDPSRLQGISRVLSSMPLPAGAAIPSVRSTTELDKALTGADVVFSAIRAGGAQGRVTDERVALNLGLIGQETVGAGGISYGLRSIPEMLNIAHRLRELSPDAWLINFTNPAGMVTEALLPILGKRVIGICDSPIGLVRRAAQAAGIPVPGRASSLGLQGVDYVGLNHLGWLRALEYDGVDHLPALLADEGRLAGFEEGRIFGARLLQTLGALPNEYLFYYYFRRDATRALSGTGPTRGEFLAAQQEILFGQLAGSGARGTGTVGTGSGNGGGTAFELWDAARRSREEGYLAEARPAEEERDDEDLAGGGYEEVALSVMNAVLTGAPAELILNVRNGNTFTALPPSSVIEVPSVVDANGARPLPARPLSLHQQGLMSQLKAVEESVIEAATTGDRSAALRAFTLHPLVDSAHLARKLLEGYEAAFPQLPGRWS